MTNGQSKSQMLNNITLELAFMESRKPLVKSLEELVEL